MIDARDFSPNGSHAGTESDPWPGVAIKNAIDSLNNAIDTVRIANSIWRVDSLLTVNHDNFTLEGESRDGAIIQFEGVGQLWFGGEGGSTRGILNSTFTNLFFKCDLLTQAGSPQSGLRVSNPKNFNFTNNKITGHQYGSIPGVFFEGGDTVMIAKNLIIAGPTGAASLQLQSGAGDTRNGGFVMTENELDSTGIVLIGLDEVQVTKNYLHNKMLQNMIAIMVCGKWDKTAYDIVIDGNTVDAGAANGAIISGLPNDPGGASLVDGFVISNNIIRGTGASISAQSLDANNYNDDTLKGNEKHNVTIKGNKIHAAWSGAGINLKGGAGLVDTVLVEGNTLTNDAGQPNILDKDANTRNVTVTGNTGIPNDDGTEPEPIPPQPEPPMKNTVTITVTADPPGSVNFVTDPAMSRSATPKGKPPKPPAQTPTVTITVDVEPPDTSNIVIVK